MNVVVSHLVSSVVHTPRVISLVKMDNFRHVLCYFDGLPLANRRVLQQVAAESLSESPRVRLSVMTLDFASSPQSACGEATKFRFST